MRWFKKIVRAFLALLPLFAIFLIPSSASALQYQYSGIPILPTTLPETVISNGHTYFDFSSSNSGAEISHSLSIKSNYMDKPTPYRQIYWLNNSLSVSNEHCQIDGDTAKVSSLFTWSESSSYKQFSVSGGSNSRVYVDGFHGSNPCYERGVHDIVSTGISSIESFGSSYPLPNPAEALSTFFPYRATTEYVALSDTSVSDSNGLSYSGSFSFQRMGLPVTKFQELTIPLDTYDGWFYKPENLYNGRQLEFKFVFNFKGSFAWNSDLSHGSIGVWAVDSLYYDGSSDQRHTSKLSECTNNLQVVDGATHLEISCPFTLDRNYAGFTPVLIMENPDYIWDTDNYWEFYYTFLITDGNNSFGGYLNNDSKYPGKAWSATDGVDGDNHSEPNWFDSMSNLFRFSIPASSTPLGGLFGGFTDSMSCASIPTIASMIHSTETQVCPWFNSTIRSITTPVLSLFSVLLSFGFIVRWLGSSSGQETGGGL